MTAIDECWGSGGDRLGLSDDRKESDGGLGKETMGEIKQSVAIFG